MSAPWSSPSPAPQQKCSVRKQAHVTKQELDEGPGPGRRGQGWFVFGKDETLQGEGLPRSGSMSEGVPSPPSPVRCGVDRLTPLSHMPLPSPFHLEGRREHRAVPQRLLGVALPHSPEQRRAEPASSIQNRCSCPSTCLSLVPVPRALRP